MYYYKGYFIVKDIAGYGWNIAKGKRIIDEGYENIIAAMIAIEEIEQMEDFGRNKK